MPRRRRKPKPWLVLAGVLLVFAAGLAIAGRDVFREPRTSDFAAADRASSLAPAEVDPANIRPPVDAAGELDVSRADARPLVDDDGQTLWVSPTSGEPLDLGYLPPGVQIVVALRPQALVEHPEGEKVLAALGPTGERSKRMVESDLGLALRDIDRLTIGGQIDGTGNWLVTLVASSGQQPASSFQLPAPGVEHTHAGQAYWLADDRAYWLPGGDDGRRLVVAPAELITDVIELAGNPPPLRRDLERLANHTDADRHVTILIAPNFLFSEGGDLLAEHLSRLRGPLFWFLGDELSAAALSLHWDESFFAELVGVPTLDAPPQRTARLLAARLAAIPDAVEEYVLDLQPTPYSRRVVARLPAMVRTLAAYTRSGFASDHAILRCYLPGVAGHNLLMAAELALAEPAGEIAFAGGPARATPRTSASVHDKLQQPISLRFGRDTLEAALEQLARDIGVEIVILGTDLQLDGITKNQSFGIDLENRPAEEVLVEILRLANPDRSAIGPADERQKLVYVIKAERPGGREAVFVTTRARAAERGEALPAVFVGE